MAALDYTSKIPLGQYIFRRLQALSIQHVFGCPGDYNLNLLDHLYTVEGMTWVGTCNELNGAYAADGYARAKGVPGALVTTYGVGEMSAINGVAGAYSEHVPIIHIVGTTSRLAQKNKAMIHHTIQEDHTIFQQAAKLVSTGSAFLTDEATFTEEVDRVMEVCVKTRHPVYLFVPADTCDILVDAARLAKPLDLQITNPDQHNVDGEIVDQIMTEIKNASRPCILVDGLTHRYGLVDELKEILRQTGLPAFITPLAKSLVDETSDNFIGLYIGSVTPSATVKSLIESSDLVLHVGKFPSDTNTGGFTQKLAETCSIVLHPEHVKIKNVMLKNVSFVPIVQKLARQFSQTPGLSNAGWWKTDFQKSTTRDDLSRTGDLDQDHIWRQFNSFLRKDDFIIAEVGSSQFGTLGMNLPDGCGYISQFFYSCIGFTVGALLGVLVARREQQKLGRLILFIGDGSLQMTVQEIATVIHHGFHPTIILINNEGYTVERVFHGPEKVHNDISAWDHQLLLRFFGASNSQSYSARTYEELNSILGDPKFQESSSPQLLECFLHKYDSPQLLSALVDLVDSKGEEALLEWDKTTGRLRRVLGTTLTKSGLGYKSH